MFVVACVGAWVRGCVCAWVGACVGERIGGRSGLVGGQDSGRVGGWKGAWVGRGVDGYVCVCSEVGDKGDRGLRDFGFCHDVNMICM